MSTVTSLPSVTFRDIERSAGRLQDVAHRTPVMTSRQVNERVGAEVYFKCENFQRTGSFKFRGAYNALSQFSAEDKKKGVLAYSSGNHAQAVALASALLGIPATIVMPENAPEVKLAATAGYGAEIIRYNPEETTREELAQEIATVRQVPILPPYDHPHIIAGQGTAAHELIREIGPLDVLLVCCGGGGVLSGSALAAQALSPGCNVIGVEPEAGDDGRRSFHSGMLQTVKNPDTIADGARTPYLGAITFPLIMEHVHDIVTVSDEQLVQTMFYLWERMKIIVEPTGALAAAAVLNGIVPLEGKRVGVVITGGNVDLKRVLRAV